MKVTTDTGVDAKAALHSFWQLGDGDSAALEAVAFSDTGLQLPSVFPVGVLAAASIAAQALGAAEIWKMRSGQRQQITVSMRRALTMFRSERHLTVDGKPPAEIRSPLTGYFQAGDGRWIQLHTNFPHHRDGVLRVLQCEDSHAAVAAAIKTWNAAELDARLAQEGMCAALIRSPQEWQAHPQAAAIAGLPLLEILRIGDAPAEPFDQANASRPLSGVRVLDFVARDCRAGSRAHAGAAWRRCVGDQRCAPAQYCTAGHRYRTRQALGPDRPAHGSRQGKVAGPDQGCGCFFAGIPARLAGRPGIFARRIVQIAARPGPGQPVCLQPCGPLGHAARL